MKHLCSVCTDMCNLFTLFTESKNFDTYWRLQAVHHLSVSTTVVGSLRCSATVNFPPRPVCYDPHSVVMVSGSSVGEAGVGWCGATVTLIYTHVGHFLKNLYCT